MSERIDDGEGSVIFGLASFAEGIDLPGGYCMHVVIAKLPFAVPDDPVEAALAEWVEARGGNAFMEISVPDAALRLVQAGGTYVPSRLLTAPPAAPSLELTPRQLDVLHCLQRGEPNKSIARELGLTEGTVKIHIAAILRVLQARNRTEAVIRARALGIAQQA